MAGRIVPGTPSWAVVSAWATVACVLPSSVWRVLVGLGVPLGWSQAHLDLERIPGFGTAYTLTLSVLACAAAAATLGLIQPWGERFPGWLPVLSGRRVPTSLVTVVAGIGVVLTAVIVVLSAVHWPSVSGFADRPTSPWALLMLACYVPAALWPVLLAVTLVGFLRRRAAGQNGGRRLAIS